MIIINKTINNKTKLKSKKLKLNLQFTLYAISHILHLTLHQNWSGPTQNNNVCVCVCVCLCVCV